MEIFTEIWIKQNHPYSVNWVTMESLALQQRCEIFLYISEQPVRVKSPSNHEMVYFEMVQLLLQILSQFECNSLLSLSRLRTKPTNWHVRPAKTQISLGTRPVWSESSLSAWRSTEPFATHWAHSKDWSDWADSQADLSLRLARRPFCSFCHAVAYMWRNDCLRHKLEKLSGHPNSRYLQIALSE